MIELKLRIYVGIDGFWVPCEKFTEMTDDGDIEFMELNDMLYERINDDNCMCMPDEGIGFYWATFKIEPGGDDGGTSWVETGYMLEIDELEYIGDKL